MYITATLVLYIYQLQAFPSSALLGLLSFNISFNQTYSKWPTVPWAHNRFSESSNRLKCSLKQRTCDTTYFAVSIVRDPLSHSPTAVSSQTVAHTPYLASSRAPVCYQVADNVSDICSYYSDGWWRFEVIQGLGPFRPAPIDDDDIEVFLWTKTFISMYNI